ncbi:MAG: hypothetical protein DHS20C17_29680 [Cyclobacteriaceae bacterium]|nr:MAG: hypothetical protein DHS20C17_29680 [Cyclobacteriaceae bacterium]
MENIRPWDKLQSLMDGNSIEAIKSYIDGFTSEDIVASVSHLSGSDRAKLLKLLNPEDAADLMDDIPWVQAVNIIKRLNSTDARRHTI